MTADDIETFALSESDALFLDFDGTLADIGPDPDAVSIPPAVADALDVIARRLGGALALLSGRDIRDLAGRTPSGLWRAGGHGLEIIAPGEAPPPPPPNQPEEILAPLREMALRPGVRLELKGPVAALHYRAAPEMEGACIEAADAAARLGTDLVRQAGKMVVEVKPARAHKGTALRRMAEASPFLGRRPVMIGDDTTDEDAMSVAQELGGAAIKVGAGATVARLRTASPATVRDWVLREARRGG